MPLYCLIIVRLADATLIIADSFRFVNRIFRKISISLRFFTKNCSVRLKIKYFHPLILLFYPYKKAKSLDFILFIC